MSAASVFLSSINTDDARSPLNDSQGVQIDAEIGRMFVAQGIKEEVFHFGILQFRRLVVFLVLLAIAAAAADRLPGDNAVALVAAAAIRRRFCQQGLVDLVRNAPHSLFIIIIIVIVITSVWVDHLLSWKNIY
jgi:hypothetical protein